MRLPVWRPGRRKIALILAILALFSLLHVVDLVLRPFLGRVDARAEEVAQGIALRAGTAFAVSKTINAALSMMEEVTLTGSAVVVGGSLHPAAFLKPINNLVDQFARIMLVVAAGALLMELLLHLGAGYGTSVVLAAPLALLAFHFARPDAAFCPRARRLGTFLLILAVVVRFALPVALIVTGSISDRYLAERYEAATRGLEHLQEQADAAAAAAEDQGWGRSVLDAVTGSVDAIRASFSSTFDDVVTMVTVFFLETVLLPLSVILAIWRGLILVTASDGRLR